MQATGFKSAGLIMTAAPVISPFNSWGTHGQALKIHNSEIGQRCVYSQSGQGSNLTLQFNISLCSFLLPWFPCRIPSLTSRDAKGVRPELHGSVVR